MEREAALEEVEKAARALKSLVEDEKRVRNSESSSAINTDLKTAEEYLSRTIALPLTELVERATSATDPEDAEAAKTQMRALLEDARTAGTEGDTPAAGLARFMDKPRLQK